MSALTDAELAEIEKRAEAATLTDEAISKIARGGPCPLDFTSGARFARDFYEKIIRSDRKEIARLRGIEERAKELLDNVAFCEGAECNEIARYILEGEGKVSEPEDCRHQVGIAADIHGCGKVSEPDACHEEK
jgi:predicted AAA+ superfamily ATPase